MDQLPTELWLHIGEYLDYRSLVNLSICSKHWYEATSLSYLWKRLFDIYFSVGWVRKDQIKFILIQSAAAKPRTTMEELVCETFTFF